MTIEYLFYYNFKRHLNILCSSDLVQLLTQGEFYTEIVEL